MIRVLVVEGRRAVRDGLKRLLAAAGEITVVGELAGPEDAGASPRVDADLAILGLEDVARESIAAIGRLAAAARLPILVVGPGADRSQIAAAVHEGASGYLDIASVRENLMEAVRLVCRGTVFTSAPASERGHGRRDRASGKASKAGSSGRGRLASTDGADGGRPLR